MVKYQKIVNKFNYINIKINIINNNNNINKFYENNLWN